MTPFGTGLVWSCVFAAVGAALFVTSWQWYEKVTYGLCAWAFLFLGVGWSVLFAAVLLSGGFAL